MTGPFWWMLWVALELVVIVAAITAVALFIRWGVRRAARACPSNPADFDDPT